MTTTTLDNINVKPKERGSESYGQLVWRRFRRSKPSLVGGVIVLILITLAVFAEFFAPYPLDKFDSKNSFIPPSRIHFWDKEGNFHLRPFTYNKVITLDPKTFIPDCAEDDSKMYPIQFFVKVWE